MVFYFSATGNSLYVAKMLNTNAVSIPQIIHKKNCSFQDETIGIVCPSYGGEPPQMVKEFLQKEEFHCSYFYIVMTYGASIEIAASNMRKLMEECRISAAYFNTVQMPDNYLPGFDMQQEMRKNLDADKQIQAIQRDIAKRKNFWKEPSAEDVKVYEDYQKFIQVHPEQSWRNITFHVEETCIGCGICSRVCPAGCIRVENGKAVYHETSECQHCMACIHSCPQKAVGLSIPEVNRNARYRNEHISLQELMNANQQRAGKSTNRMKSQIL